MKTADFRKKMPVKKYFPIKEYKQLSLLGKHEPDRKSPLYKHYKLVFCHKTLQIQILPFDTQTRIQVNWPPFSTNSPLFSRQLAPQVKKIFPTRPPCEITLKSLEVK